MELIRPIKREKQEKENKRYLINERTWSIMFCDQISFAWFVKVWRMQGWLRGDTGRWAFGRSAQSRCQTRGHRRPRTPFPYVCVCRVSFILRLHFLSKKHMSNSREVHMAFIERRGKYKSYMRSGISIFSTIYIYAHRFPCTYLSSYEPFFKLREYNTLYHVISSLKNFFYLTGK